MGPALGHAVVASWQLAPTTIVENNLSCGHSYPEAVCDKMKRSSPGAQTERRGDAGPVRLLRSGEVHRQRSIQLLDYVPFFTLLLPGWCGSWPRAASTDAGVTIVCVVTIAVPPTRRDPFFQLDDLEAALPLGLTGQRALDLAA
jgi:hypothetical protein